MNALENISQLPSTRQQATNLSEQLISAIQNGEINPLKLKIMFKGIEEVIKNVKPVLDDAALTEAQKYSAKTFSYQTAKLTITEAGTRYDFSNCNHPAYMRINQQVEAAKAEMKGIEDVLKAMKKSEVIVDEDTGEAVTVYPAAKKSTTTVSVTLI